MADWSKHLSTNKVIVRTEQALSASLFVIATEGKRTEPDYFAAVCGKQELYLGLPPEDEAPNGPAGILERLLSKRGELESGITEPDRCWIVCDVDHHSAAKIDSVCKRAIEAGVNVAVSNPCFEYWLYLHQFDKDEAPPEICSKPVTQRAGRMKEVTNYEYRRKNAGELRKDILAAIRRARKGESDRKARYPKDCPGTDVYLLVEQLISRSMFSGLK